MIVCRFISPLYDQLKEWEERLESMREKRVLWVEKRVSFHSTIPFLQWYAVYRAQLRGCGDSNRWLVFLYSTSIPFSLSSFCHHPLQLCEYSTTALNNMGNAMSPQSIAPLFPLREANRNFLWDSWLNSFHFTGCETRTATIYPYWK